MFFKNLNIGFSFIDTFENFNVSKDIIDILSKDNNIIPIMSFNNYNLDTYFFKRNIENVDFKLMLDILVICPCTSNIIAKLAYDIIDSPFMFIVKSHINDNKPIVLAISAEDGLSTSASNIGKLLNTKNYYFVPFKQSNPITKPYKLSFDKTYIIKTIEEAIEGRQIQPTLLQI